MNALKHRLRTLAAPISRQPKSRRGAIAILLVLYAVFGADIARPDVYITAEEVGGDVVFSYNGLVDTTNLTIYDTFFRSGDEGFIYPEKGQFVAATDGTTVVRYSDPLTPNMAFGPGPFNISGLISPGSDTFGLYLISPGEGGTEFFLPSSYLSGAEFSGSVVFPSSTLAGLGVVTTPFSTELGTSGNTIFFFTDSDSQDLAQQFQLTGSAIPMNQTIGQFSPNIHRVGSRTINSRLFRVRGRVEADDGFVSTGSSFVRRSREVAASRFFQWQRELKKDTTVQLNGVNKQSPTAQADSLETTVLSDGFPMLSVTQTADCLAPGCLAAGENWMVFGHTDYGNVGLDNLGGNPGMDSSSYGTTLGLEYQVNECVNVGLGWSHTWSDIDLTGGLGSADIEGDAAIVYATYFRNNFWGDLLYSFGSYEVDTTRNHILGTAFGGSNIDAHQASLNLGYNMVGNLSCTPFRDIFTDNKIVHGPTLGIDYSTGTLDGYNERGDGAVTFADQDYDFMTTTVGWQATGSRETVWGGLRPQLRVGYGRENFDQNSTVTGTLANNPLVTATQTSILPGDDWLEFGAGLSFEFNCSNFRLYLDYTGQYLRDNVDVHYASLRGKIQF